LLFFIPYGPIVLQNSQKIKQKIVDKPPPLCYDVFTCEKGLFFCGHFSAPGGYVVVRTLNFSLAGVIQGGNI
jgi:hypothetical protein